MAEPAPPRPARRRGLVRRLLFALVATPLAAAVLAGWAAGGIGGPASWPLQLAAIGLPYAALAAAAAALYAALTRRPRWTLALAALAALVATRAWPARGVGPDAGDLVLTTFNVPVPDPPGAMADSVVALIGRTRPHVLALQDSWVYPSGRLSDQPPHVRALLRETPYRLTRPARLVARTGWQTNSMGTPLLVRTQPSSAAADAARVEVLEQTELALGEGDDASQALRSVMRWQGRRFVLYNVHLRSYGRPKPWSDSTVSARDPATWRPYARRYRRVFAERHVEADLLAERIAAETEPVVIVGDFNSTPDQYSLRRLRYATAGAPLADAFREAAGWRWGRTYHARRPLVRIDFVLVDPTAFEVAAARTFAVTSSDHRPVEVRLRWRGRAADTTATRPAAAPDTAAGR